MAHTVAKRKCKEADIGAFIDRQPELHGPDEAEPSEKIGQTQIIDLNTDCLLEICEYLKIKPLTALAETCKRMQEVARKSFSTRDIEGFVHGYLYFEHRKHIEFADEIEFLRCSRIYGDLITTIGMNTDIPLKPITHESVMKYCSGSVTFLSFHTCTMPSGFDFNCSNTLRLLANLKKLKVIHFTYFRATDINPLLKKCENLLEFSVSSTYGRAPLLMSTRIASLRCLDFNYAAMGADMLRANSHVSHVKCSLSSQYVDEILQHVPHIETLEILCCQADNGNLRRLPEFQRLRSLIFRIRIPRIGDLIRHARNVFASLDEFACELTDDARWADLAQMNSLTELRLRLKSFVASDLREFLMPSNAKNLRSLKIAYKEDVEFSDPAWSRIIEMCQKRKISLRVLGNAPFRDYYYDRYEEKDFYNMHRNDKIISAIGNIVFVHRPKHNYYSYIREWLP